jgi:hypothetical protein
MGQLRQAQCPVGTEPTLAMRLATLRWQMLPPLTAGFVLASVAVFALVGICGTLLRSALSIPLGTLLIVVLIASAGCDLAFPRFRPTLLNRQTPRNLTDRFSNRMTGFLWGLDAGTVVSTFRSSAASWAALTLTFAGWGPWWTGLAYASAFCVPLGLLIVSHPPAAADGEKGWRRASTEAVVDAVLRGARYVRLASAAAAVAAIGAYWSLF